MLQNIDSAGGGVDIVRSDVAYVWRLQIPSLVILKWFYK